MAFSSGDPIEYGKELADRTKSPWDFAGENLMDSFKKKRDIDIETGKLKEIEAYKSTLESPKDKAQRGLYDAQSAWMKGIGGMPEEEGLVLDSYGKSGPRYINAKSRLEQKTLGTEASQLPKLDRALVAVQSLKSQYQRSLTPTSIKSGSNPFVGFLKKGQQGIKQNIGSVSGSNPEMNRYKANKEGFASLISKGGFMEAGVLTNEDIKRITNILPSEYSSKEEADIAWNEIEGILSAARKQFEANSGMQGIRNSGQGGKSTQPGQAPIIDEGTTKTIQGVTYTKRGGKWMITK